MNRIIGLVTINSLILILFLVSYFINRLSNNGIFFGVRFPIEYLQERELNKLDKSYKKIMASLFLLLFLIVNIVSFRINPLDDEAMGWIIGSMAVGSLIVSNVIFIIYYFKTKKLKKEKGWTYKGKNLVVTDTTFRKPKKDEKFKPIDSKIFLLLLILPIIMFLLTVFKYNSLPQVMEIPNSTFGVFNTETLRGKLIMFQIPLTQLFIGILMYVVSLVMNNSRVDLNSGSIEETVIRKKKFRRVSSIMILAIAFQTMLMFSAIQCSIFLDFDITIINYIFIICLFFTIFIFMVLFITIGQGGRNLQKSEEKDELYKDDDDKWILGGFYYNKNDPAWMVEKRTGIGWTVNFANPKSWIAMGALTLFIVINIVLSIVIS